MTSIENFRNVTLYTEDQMWGNIIRIDVSWARLSVAPYAQYKERLHIEFLRVRKRKSEALVCRDLIVVPTVDAIEPDGLYISPVDGVSRNCYRIGDPSWKSDIQNQLQHAQVPILYQKSILDTETVTPATLIEPTQHSATLEPTHSQHDGPEHKLEYEEGIRYQAEKSFFSRNPQLVEEAKKTHGLTCQVCLFNFAEHYGDLGQNFIEVHHLSPLSERPKEEWSDMITTSLSEVSVLCANCHRMVHRQRPALSLEQLKAAHDAAKLRVQ